MNHSSLNVAGFTPGAIRRVVAALCCALACTALVSPASAAPVHVSDMPSVEQVRAVVHGNDPIDTQARLVAAFRQLSTVVRTLSTAGNNGSAPFSADEVVLLGAYGKAASDAQAKGQALLAVSGAPKSGPDSPNPKFFRLTEGYHPSSLEPWILEHFPHVKNAFETQRSKDNNIWKKLDRATATIDPGVAERLLILALLGVCSMPLLLILYPVLAFKTYPGTPDTLPISGFRAGHGRFQLAGFTGVLVQAGRSVAKDVYTKYRNGMTVGSHEVTTVYDSLVLRDQWGNTQAFEVADFHVASALGHWLTVVSATRPRGGQGYYVAVLDRTSGNGFFRFQSWGLFLGAWRMLAALMMALVLGVALAVTVGFGAIALPLLVGWVLRAGTKHNIATFRQRVMARA